MKKAQIWSMDFAISIIIFFSVVVVLIFFFNNILSQNLEQSEIFKIQKTALKASDSLIRIPGSPANWTSDNVSIIGLASEDNVLDAGKVQEFISMDYNKARVLLVGKYQFHFEIRDLNDSVINVNGTNLIQGIFPMNANIIIPIERYVITDGDDFTVSGGNISTGMLQEPVAYVATDEHHILSVLNDFSIVWDFYWCSSDSIPNNNARDVYQIPDNKECFGDIIENSSVYNSILSEDIPLMESDFSGGDPRLNESHKQWLKDFVSGGNRYIEEEEEEEVGIVCMFNMSGCGEPLGDVGVVESLTYLKNLSLGEEITFDDEPSAIYSASGDNALNIEISEKDNPSRALFGYWDYGSGRVFYIPDLEDNENLIEKFNIGEVITVEIPVSIAKLRLIVWI